MSLSDFLNHLHDFSSHVPPRVESRPLRSQATICCFSQHNPVYNFDLHSYTM